MQIAFSIKRVHLFVLFVAFLITRVCLFVFFLECEPQVVLGETALVKFVNIITRSVLLVGSLCS